jgi:hypothetical protein
MQTTTHDRLWPASDASVIDSREEISHSASFGESGYPANEIGVINVIRTMLVPIEGVWVNGDRKEQTDFDLMFDESVDPGQLWIEIAPPNQSVALLNKRSEGNLQMIDGYQIDTSPVFLNCDDFQRVYRELVDRDVNFVAGPSRMPFGWLALFEDTEGRRFMLGQW